MSDIFKAKVNNQWVGIPSLVGPQGPQGQPGVVHDVLVSTDSGQTYQSALDGSDAKIILPAHGQIENGNTGYVNGNDVYDYLYTGWHKAAWFHLWEDNDSTSSTKTFYMHKEVTGEVHPVGTIHVLKFTTSATGGWTQINLRNYEGTWLWLYTGQTGLVSPDVSPLPTNPYTQGLHFSFISPGETKTIWNVSPAINANTIYSLLLRIS